MGSKPGYPTWLPRLFKEPMDTEVKLEFGIPVRDEVIVYGIAWFGHALAFSVHKPVD